jgi:hypothetical protein
VAIYGRSAAAPYIPSIGNMPGFFLCQRCHGGPPRRILFSEFTAAGSVSSSSLGACCAFFAWERKR